MLFMGYGALIARSLAGSDSAPVRKLGSMTSGIGLLLILIAGFGMISKLGHSFTAPWLIVKMVDLARIRRPDRADQPQACTR